MTNSEAEAETHNWVQIASACRDAVSRAPHGDKVDVLREAANEHGLSDSHVRRMIRALAFVEALHGKDRTFAQALRNATFRVAELVDRWSQYAPQEAKAAAQRYFANEVNFKGFQALFELANSNAEHRVAPGGSQLPDDYVAVAVKRAKALAEVPTQEVAVDGDARLASGVDRLLKAKDDRLFAIIITPPGLSTQAYGVRRKLDAGRIALHRLVDITTIVILPEEAEPAEFTAVLSMYKLQDTPVGVIRVKPQYYTE
jgi:hypothetical protein